MICAKCGIDRRPEEFADRKRRDGTLTKRRQCNSCRNDAHRERVGRLPAVERTRFKRLRTARQQRYAETHPFYWIAKQMRYRARKDGVVYDEAIDAAFLETLWDRQAGRCALTGEPMVRDQIEERGWRHQGQRVGLARVDPMHAYTPDNVELAKAGVVLCKNYHPDDDFVDICRRVASHVNRPLIERAVAAGRLPAVFRWRRA